MTRPSIEQIEAELRESQFAAWDVEVFLANRHQAKIDALTAEAERQNPWRRRWTVAKELITIGLAFIGYLTVLTVGALWLLTGEFPIHPIS